MKYFAIFFTGLFLLVSQSGGAQTLFSENFKSNNAQLHRQGWRLKTARTCDKDGFRCLELINLKNKRLLTAYFIKVKIGKRYTISCIMKTENVKKTQKNSRGATIFAEFADANKKHVSGGTFPKGLFGTNDWKEFKILFTDMIPDGVKYIKLYVALEGQGKMWVRNLKVTHFNSWSQVKTFTPAVDKTISITRPVFAWEGRKKQWELIVASDLNLKNDVKRFFVGKCSKFTLPIFLPRGTKWYWQVRDSASPKHVKKIFASKINSFTIAKNAEQWPVLIESAYKWSDVPRPELMIQVIGAQNVKIQASIDGGKCEQISFSDSKFVFRPVVNLNQGVHKCEFKIENTKGEIISVSNNYCNVIPDSKVTFRNRITYVDGKPFFPIGCYRDPSDQLVNFSGIRKAGFNLAHSYVFHHKNCTVENAEKYLQAAQDNDIKIFMAIKRSWIKNKEDSQIENYVGALMKYPSLLCWYLFDEPILHKLPVQLLESANKTIKQVDPFHPTMLVSHSVHFASKTIKRYADATDIFSCDPYPSERNSPLSLVHRWVSNSRKMVGKSRPVWAVIEAFDNEFWKNGKKYKKVKQYGPVKKPTYKKLRCMTYLALSASADGIIYYWLPNWAYDIRKDAPEVWNSLCRMVKELKSLESFMLYPDNNPIKLKVSKPIYFWSRKNAKGVVALALINADKKAHKISIDISKLKGKIYLGEKLVKRKANKLSLSLKPYEVKLFKIH